MVLALLRLARTLVLHSVAASKSAHLSSQSGHKTFIGMSEEPGIL